jgi:hypothetical protein
MNKKNSVLDVVKNSEKTGMMLKGNNGGFVSLADGLIGGVIESTKVLESRICSNCGLSKVTR